MLRHSRHKMAQCPIFLKRRTMTETNKGYVRVYTGDGQGKTTAAFGVLMRALCAGKTAYVGQFVKDMMYNEAMITQYCKRVEVEQLGQGCFLDRVPMKYDAEAARTALDLCKTKMASGAYDLVILDELTIAMHYNLLTAAEVIEALDARHETTEVIITGRYAPQELIDYADLVTDMHEVKHYLKEGVYSRDGFDH